MEIYSENMEPIASPDLTLGYLTEDVRIVHHEAISALQEVWHYEVIAQYPNGGKEVERVIDVEGVEAREAWDERIPIRIYHPYTQSQIEAMKENEKQMTPEERIAALEAEVTRLKALLA